MASMTSHSQGSFSSFSLTGDRRAYDVFLSFRGEDTRNTFINHLYTALHQKGINTYIDDKLIRGEKISLALVKAIEKSRISIIVLSENYASSSWCLDELLKILDCKEARKQMVLPVFYNVDPSDVRHQKNNFGKAFAKLEDKYFMDNLKSQRWKLALHEIANLSGWHLGINGNESTFIQSIVEMVSRIVNRTHLYVAKFPVGIESRVWDINVLLSIGMNDIRMVGIFGVGGIGKTTIAKAVYNSIANQFEGSCFLANVSEKSKRECGMVQLQNAMLFEIQGDTSLNVLNVDRGICMIKERLSYRKVLLVLDDVDQSDQLDKLAGSCDWFGSGSRIIITTRDKGLLTSHEVGLTYKMKELNYHEAFKLFSWHAFKEKKPIDNYVKSINGVISYARGLPLALTVLGSDLCGKSIDHWKSALDKYKTIPNKSIQEILVTSYDGLDDNEKDIFLDVACFFKGESVDYVTEILVGCGFFPVIGIKVLVDKCLITIEHNILGMHDLVQEMGREIVRKESPKEPGERSRLWFHEDVVRVLGENMGTRKVEGIMVDLPKRDMIRLSSKAFLEMKRLRLFINCNAKFSRRLNNLPNELRLLDWPEYPSESLLSNLCPRKLVVLKMHNSLFKEIEGFKNLQFMKIMDFSMCEFLTKIPDLSGSPNLEKLTFDYCTNLVEVHDSVGFLEKLVTLSLLTCYNLSSFPRSFKLRSLEVLFLNGCSRLENFPEIEVKMERIKFIGLNCTHIKELPSSIVNLIGLETLSLEGCENLMGLPSSIHQFQHLRRLYLCYCSKLVHFPTVFPTLRSLDLSNRVLSESNFLLNFFSTLEMLDLSGSNFVSIPTCINRFVGLRHLKLNDCKQLKEILQLPPKIEELYASGCISLERFSKALNRLEFSTCKLPRRRWFDLSRCHKNIGNDMENLLLGEVRHCAFGIIHPGNKIPDWFNHYRKVSSRQKFSNYYEIEVEEPSDLDGEIIGMVVYVVFEMKDGKAPVDINCTVKFSCNNIYRRCDGVWRRCEREEFYYCNKFNLLGSDQVWFYVPESIEPKGEYRRITFSNSTESVSFKSCGVHLVRRYDQKAKKIVKEYTNPSQDEGVDFSLDVPNEDIRNSVLTKRRRDDYYDDDDNLEFMPYPQQKRCSISEVEESPGESQQQSNHPTDTSI